MLKFGTIEKVNPPHVRVKFDDADGMASYNLAVVMPFTFEDKAYWSLAVGTQVACLMDENSEEGVVLGAIYSEADPAPVNDINKFYIEFKDGTIIEYDKANHELNADVKGSVEIIAQEEINLNCPAVNINSINISMVGNVSVSGSMTASGDVIAGSISLKNHTHIDPQGGNTGAAQ